MANSGAGRPPAAIESGMRRRSAHSFARTAMQVMSSEAVPIPLRSGHNTPSSNCALSRRARSNGGSAMDVRKAASTPAIGSRLLQQRDLARGRVEVGAHAVEHVIDRRRGGVTVISEVISDYLRGDLAKDPGPGGEHR